MGHPSIAPFSNTNPIAAYACGHTFHEDCLRSSLTQSMKCPTCRAAPVDINLRQIECSRCTESSNGSDEDLIMLTRRCNHLHFGPCQRSHLSTLNEEYPPSIEGYNAIISARDIMGCHACVMQTPMTFDISTIIHPVAFEQGMTDYIDLGTNGIPPPVLPNPVPLMAPSPPAVVPPPSASGHPPRLSGSNNIPIARRDRRVSFAGQARRNPDTDSSPQAAASSPRTQNRERRSPRERLRRQERSRS